MSSRIAISTPNAPPPLPQFSQAIKLKDMLYCSGNIGMDPATGKIVEGTVTDRARQALRNLAAVLAAGGSGFDRVVKANIFLTSMDNFNAVNAAWDEVFTQDPKPVSTAAFSALASYLLLAVACRVGSH